MEFVIGTSYPYVVIETFEREVHSIHFCTGKANAIKKANEILVTRILEVGCDGTTDKEINREISRLTHMWEAQKASTKNLNAWCNLKGNWDAHIIPVKSTTVSMEGGLQA